MSQTPTSGQAPRIHDDPGHPHDEFFDSLARGAGAALRERRAAGRSRLPWRRSRKRRAVVTIVHNEPVFLPLWLRYYSRFFAARGHLRARQREQRRLDRAGLQPGRGRPRPRRPRVDGDDAVGLPGRAARALRRRPRLRRRTRSSRRTRRSATSAPTSTGSRRSSSTRSATRSCTCPTGAAARPGAPDPRPARPLVRQRRLRQAAAGDRADDLGPGSARERRRSPQLRSGPAPHPPASNGLRGLPRPPRRRARGGAGTREDLDAGWAAYNRIDAGDEFDRWYLRRDRVRERGDRDGARARSPSAGGRSCERPARDSPAGSPRGADRLAVPARRVRPPSTGSAR